MVTYTLTVPLNDNDGFPLPTVHQAVKDRLELSFGGWTAVDATGGWFAPGADNPGIEAVIVYHVDAPDTSESFAILRELATTVKVVAEQDSVRLTRQPIEVFYI